MYRTDIQEDEMFLSDSAEVDLCNHNANVSLSVCSPPPWYMAEEQSREITKTKELRAAVQRSGAEAEPCGGIYEEEEEEEDPWQLKRGGGRRWWRIFSVGPNVSKTSNSVAVKVTL